MRTLIVNLFGGPGVGKSTNAALTFAKLKMAGVNAEIAHEYAKDLTWEERHKAIQFQPYVAAKQMWRVHRLIGQVDVVITDSPILLSLIYKGQGYTPAFERFVLDTYRHWNTLNIFLQRNDEAHPYVESGRTQSKAQAFGVDREIYNMLMTHQIQHHGLRVTGNDEAAQDIVDLIALTNG